MGRAAAGVLNEKEQFVSPYPPTYLAHHPQVRDRLNSSYDDVSFECHYIRNHVHHNHRQLAVLAVDGRCACQPMFLESNSSVYLLSPTCNTCAAISFSSAETVWRTVG